MLKANDIHASIVMRIPGLSRKSLFRARSPERDSHEDMRAINGIAAALTEAMESCEREMSGLARRLDMAKAGASLLAGSGIDEHLEREAVDARELRALESQMAAAENRLRAIKDRHHRLKKVNETFVAEFPDAVKLI
jgi:hypothetical protein